MIWFFTVLFFSYFFSIMTLYYGFRKVKRFPSAQLLDKTWEGSVNFSVIIPFRNEADNLPNLLKTIESLNYPSELFEIIFVNDASEDNSKAIIYEAITASRFSIKLLQNKRVSNSPKKDAISEAIKKSSFDWIVTTDADCKLPENWLKTLDRFIQQNNSIMVCGPVKYGANRSYIQKFQQLDGLSLQAVTIGSFGIENPILSNGANLAYSKAAFFKVNGFSGNEHVASGDDIFLMEKMKNIFPGQVRFLKSEEAIISTKPQTSWLSVINQRIRWASKTSKQKNTISLLLGSLVFLVNISILALPLLMIFQPANLIFYTLLIGFKIITDFIFVRQVARFFSIKISFWRFPLQTFVYAGIVLIVVLGSLRGNYSWKGRSFKKV